MCLTLDVVVARVLSMLGCALFLCLRHPRALRACLGLGLSSCLVEMELFTRAKCRGSAKLLYSMPSTGQETRLCWVAALRCLRCTSKAEAAEAWGAAEASGAVYSGQGT